MKVSDKMFPQSKPPKKFSTSTQAPHHFRFYAGLIAATLMLSACDGQAPSGPPHGMQGRTEVSIVTLHPQSVAITAELPGRTAASLTAQVRPQVSGIIQSRLYKEGAEVKAGQALYQIDPASYKAAYDSAVATLQKAEASVPSARAKAERYRELIKQSAVSKQELDDAEASLAQAVAEVASAKAGLETARINLAYTKITAPITGRIDKSALTPGALVTANQETALTTIRMQDPIYVDVTQSTTNQLILQQAVADGRLKLRGSNVSVKLILDNNIVYPHTGVMEFAEANVDQTTGTFSLRAEFPNPNRMLLPGMFVRAIVQEGIAENSFLVPQRAVTYNSKGEPTVLVVDQDNKVQQKILTVRKNVGNNWLVDAGITDGDRVIVEGNLLVRIGQDVSTVEVKIDETTGEVKDRAPMTSSTPATSGGR